MARLTDNNGVLLGGLETSLSRLLPPLTETQAAAITVPAEPPLPPKYRLGEIVYGLHCAFGSLTYLAYSATLSAPRAGGSGTPLRQGCALLIEESGDRHFCPACGGYYCLTHAEPAAHECRSVRRTKQA